MHDPHAMRGHDEDVGFGRTDLRKSVAHVSLLRKENTMPNGPTKALSHHPSLIAGRNLQCRDCGPVASFCRVGAWQNEALLRASGR